MGYQFQENKRKKLRRRVWLAFWVYMFFLIPGIAMYYGYDHAKEEVAITLNEKQTTINELEAANTHLQAELAEIKNLLVPEVSDTATTENATDTMDLAALEDIQKAISQQLSKGITHERIIAYINNIPQELTCEFMGRKNLQITTELLHAESGVSFYSNMITLTGKGISAKSVEGLPEAWYDQTLPIEVSMRFFNTEKTLQTTLPYEGIYLHENKEFKLKLAPSDHKEYISVELEICR